MADASFQASERRKTVGDGEKVRHDVKSAFALPMPARDRNALPSRFRVGQALGQRRLVRAGDAQMPLWTA